MPTKQYRNAQEERLVEFSVLKLLEMFKAPMRWLYNLLVEQTKISISGQQSIKQQDNTLWISEHNEEEGNLLFGISTASNNPIEILKVEIDYSAPLQLFDPKKMGFFLSDLSSDEVLPFRIYCEGVFPIRSDLQQMFALTARFPSGACELPVRVTVHARVRTTSVGSFDTYGRIQITKFLYRIALCDAPMMGIAVPPKNSISSPQPYLIQSACYVSGEAYSVLVHQQMKDGSVSTGLFEGTLEKIRK